MGRPISTLKTAVNGFIEDECMASGAALAYYTIFSLPPLIVLVFLIAGSLGLPHERIDDVVRRQIGLPLASGDNKWADSAVPRDDPSYEGAGSASLEQMAQRGSSRLSPIESLGVISKVIGGLILLFSASGVFAQLQTALNRAWDVAPDPEQSGWKNFVIKRVLSFGMIVVIAFLLLVSLVLTTLVDEFIAWTAGHEADVIATTAPYVLNDVVGLALATALFAMMFKILPDARMAWKDIWAGAFATAVLFSIGKSALGWYLQHSQIGTEWGSAAGSMITLLVWVYYTSLIVLFGAEITQAWESQSGRKASTERGAVRVATATTRADGRPL